MALVKESLGVRSGVVEYRLEGGGRVCRGLHRRGACDPDCGFLFDIVVVGRFPISQVCIGSIDVFLLAPFFPEAAGVLRVFTVLRALRLIKLLRVGVAAFPKGSKQLIRLIDAVRPALKTIFIVLLLTLMLVYFFGILCAVIVGKQREL